MKQLSCAWFVAAAVIAGHLGLAAAESARFRHVTSVYFDAKGVGLSLPEGVACNAAGQFIVGDTGNDRLLRFTLRDKAVTEGAEIKIPQLSAPSRVALNSKGEIYALDSKLRRVVRLAPSGEFKEALSYAGVPGQTTILAKDFTIDAADNLYVLDVFSARVLVLDAQGQYQRALPFPGSAGFGSELALDSTGRLLLLDAIERRLYAAAKDGGAFEPLGGDLSQFLATVPSSMTTSKGVIFVVEGSGGSVVAFGRDASFLSRQMNDGWNEGSLRHPAQMCVNDRDEVFIADRDNSRVQVFQLMR